MGEETVGIGEIDQFVGQIVKSGNSLVVTIPAINVKVSGLKEGQLIKVFYKQVQKEENQLEKKEE